MITSSKIIIFRDTSSAHQTRQYCQRTKFLLWHMQDYVTQTLNGIYSTLKYNDLLTKKNRFVLHNIAAHQHAIKGL